MTELDPALKDFAARFENLKLLISCFTSRAAFCRASGADPGYISLFFTDLKEKKKRLGPDTCRKIEHNLGIPKFCMDAEDGVRGELERVKDTHALLEANAGEVRTTTRPTVMKLKPLHQAALDAFEAALKANTISDHQCVALIAQWLPTPAPATLDEEGEAEAEPMRAAG